MAFQPHRRSFAAELLEPGRMFEDQTAFVAWWDEFVSPDGRPRKKTSADRGWISQADAEKQTGISHQQVSRWRKMLQDQEDYRKVLYGTLWSKAMAGGGGQEVHFSSESPEWYTPQDIIDRAVAVLGEIDIDPCANSARTVPAKVPEEQFRARRSRARIESAISSRGNVNRRVLIAERGQALVPPGPFF